MVDTVILQPGWELRRYNMYFADDLLPGDTIGAIETPIIAVCEGTDAGPALVIGTPTANTSTVTDDAGIVHAIGTVAQFTATTPLDNVDYLVTIRFTATPSGEKIEGEGIIQGRDIDCGDQ